MLVLKEDFVVAGIDERFKGLLHLLGLLLMLHLASNVEDGGQIMDDSRIRVFELRCKGFGPKVGLILAQVAFDQVSFCGFSVHDVLYNLL
ncbi:hypothetical protein SDC9_89136 [bioreactor metagenome]|uniref:Uncharacterized protein n=1 Tax=bioreactor metagenome TaxID=1076179 RepID=A0A644ZRF8_9ZZZZ